jgi:hypothetical protein
MCGVMGIYEITQLVRSLPKRRHIAILEDMSVVNGKITFFLHMPPCSLLDMYQLAGEILLDPPYGYIRAGSSETLVPLSNSEASHPGDWS